MFLFIQVEIGDWYASLYLSMHIESLGVETLDTWRKRKMHQDIKQQSFTMNRPDFFWQKSFSHCHIQRSNNYYDSKKLKVTTDLCNVSEIKIKPTAFHQTLVHSSLLNTLFWSNYTKLFTEGATGKIVRVSTRAYAHARKHFFTVRVNKHWQRSPRDVAETPSSEICKSTKAIWTRS